MHKQSFNAFILLSLRLTHGGSGGHSNVLQPLGLSQSHLAYIYCSTQRIWQVCRILAYLCLAMWRRACHLTGSYSKAAWAMLRLSYKSDARATAPYTPVKSSAKRLRAYRRRFSTN